MSQDRNVNNSHRLLTLMVIETNTVVIVW